MSSPQIEQTCIFEKSEIIQAPEEQVLRPNSLPLDVILDRSPHLGIDLQIL